MDLKEIDDLLFISNVSGLAKQVSELDAERIKKLLKDSEWLDENDDVTRRIMASMALLAYIAIELKKVVPSQAQVRRGIDHFKKLLPPELEKQVDEYIRNILDGNVE